MAKETKSDKSLRVRRGRVDSVNLYEVKENELEILENGEPTSIQLNFAVFLLSLAFSGILTLCTATFTKPIIENTFLFVSIIGIVGGIFLILMWWNGRKSIKTVIQIIKDRIQPELIDEGEEELDVIKTKDKVTTDSDIINPEG